MPMKADNEICEYLRQQTFIAFDTETTGLWAPANRIVEIGAVKFQPGDKKPEEFQTLVNPEKPIPPEVIKIHHITDSDVADAPLAGEVMKNFIQFCGPDSILIAHNAPFDISFVGCELDRAEMRFGDNFVLDTADIFRRYFPSLASYSLLSLAQHFSIVDIQSHRALDDAVIVQRLFEIAAPKLGDVKKISDLGNIISTYKMDDWRARNGSGLTVEKIVDIARNNISVELAPDALERMKKCRAMLEKKIEANEIMYGVNTGIGEFSEVVLNDDQVKDFQKYLIYNHSAGIGDPAPITCGVERME